MYGTHPPADIEGPPALCVPGHSTSVCDDGWQVWGPALIELQRLWDLHASSQPRQLTKLYHAADSRPEWHVMTLSATLMHTRHTRCGCMHPSMLVTRDSGRLSEAYCLEPPLMMTWCYECQPLTVSSCQSYCQACQACCCRVIPVPVEAQCGSW